MGDIVRETDKKRYFWVQYIQQRIRQNKNFLGMISGQTGSGKSWSGLSMGQLLDDTFGIDRVIFKGRELMRMINSGELPKKRGVCFVWDEAGIDLSSKNWQSMANKMLNFLMQTFRHRCFILLFTSPYTDFVDASTRKLFHAEFKTRSINFDARTVKIQPKLLQYNAEMKKFYKKYLRVIGKGGGVVPLTEWNVPAPTKELIDIYEQKKTEFTDDLNRTIEGELVKLEGRKPLTPLQEQILQCWKDGLTVQTEIADRLGKFKQQISANVGYMRNKGFEVDKYKNTGVNDDTPKRNLTFKNGKFARRKN